MMASDRRPDAERVREVQETFARANEQIRASAEKYDFQDHVPFLCECSDVTCTGSVRLSLTNYREARAWSDAFLLLPGHDDPDVERIAARGDGYLLIRKSLTDSNPVTEAGGFSSGQRPQDLWS
jgi:hypothetical protein